MRRRLTVALRPLVTAEAMQLRITALRLRAIAMEAAGAQLLALTAAAGQAVGAARAAEDMRHHPAAGIAAGVAAVTTGKTKANNSSLGLGVSSSRRTPGLIFASSLIVYIICVIGSCVPAVRSGQS